MYLGVEPTERSEELARAPQDPKGVRLERQGIAMSAAVGIRAESRALRDGLARQPLVALEVLERIAGLLHDELDVGRLIEERLHDERVVVVREQRDVRRSVDAHRQILRDDALDGAQHGYGQPIQIGKVVW